MKNLSYAILLTMSLQAMAQKGGGADGECVAPAPLTAAQYEVQLKALADGGTLAVDPITVKNVNMAAGNAELLADFNTTAPIASANLSGLVVKDQLSISTTLAEAANATANAISLGHLIMPTKSLTLPRFIPTNTSSDNAKLLANYLIALSDEDLIKMLKFELTGNCKLITRSYLPISIRNVVALDQFIYVDDLSKNVSQSRVSFSPQVQLIPGVGTSAGITMGCANMMRIENCKQSTQEARSAGALRELLRTTLATFGGSDICNLNKVVTQMTATSAAVTYNQAVEGQNVKFYKKGKNDPTRLCFYKISDANAFPTNLVVNLEGSPYTPLPSNVCKIFHSVLYKGDKKTLGERALARDLPVFPAEVSLPAPVTSGSVNVEQHYALAHIKYAELLQTDPKLTLAAFNSEIKVASTAAINTIDASSGEVHIIAAKPLTSVTAVDATAIMTCGGTTGGGGGGGYNN